METFDSFCDGMGMSENYRTLFWKFLKEKYGSLHTEINYLEEWFYFLKYVIEK